MDRARVRTPMSPGQGRALLVPSPLFSTGACPARLAAVPPALATRHASPWLRAHRTTSHRPSRPARWPCPHARHRSAAPRPCHGRVGCAHETSMPPRPRRRCLAAPNRAATAPTPDKPPAAHAPPPRPWPRHHYAASRPCQARACTQCCAFGRRFSLASSPQARAQPCLHRAHETPWPSRPARRRAADSASRALRAHARPQATTVGLAPCVRAHPGHPHKPS